MLQELVYDCARVRGCGKSECVTFKDFPGCSDAARSNLDRWGLWLVGRWFAVGGECVDLVDVFLEEKFPLVCFSEVEPSGNGVVVCSNS